jgi:hypothetical protein
MKNTKIYITLTTVILLIAGMTSCKQKVAETIENVVTLEVPQNPYLVAIESYLVDSLGKNYSPGEVCIPAYSVINIEEPGEPSDSTEVISATNIKVWGDWWIFNYNIVGDTLKCVSGGNHPGLMHLKQNNTHKWVVSSFDQVEDGSRNLPSAKRIFGEYYDTFHKTNSDQHHRDSVRLTQVAYYVQQHNLPVTMLQDYGWPAVELPLNR